MSYDFNTRTSRKGTGSLKWEQMYDFNPHISEEAIPLSVADMEFKTAPEIAEGLKDFLDDAILGYTGPYDSFLQAVVDWQKNRHNWQIEKDWIVNTQGVVSALHAAIRVLTQTGDGVITFHPVYYPFGVAIENNDRTEVNVPLQNNNGHYTIDFDAFEKEAAKSTNKMVLFCSPHNPGGRVWTKEELKKVADIAVKHDLYVVSDEIWYDFTMPGHEHTVLATVDEKINDLLITCTAPSKSFNLAGLMISNIIISSDDIRKKFSAELDRTHTNMIGILGFKACELAYTKAEKWLDEVIEVIDTNQHIVHEYFKEHFPQIKAPLLEGTYVQWLDFSGLGMTDEEMEEILYQEASFITGRGNIFGDEGVGFERLNIALPTDALQEALSRLGTALNKRLNK
ncbi:MAG TPA: MalY/PatB family protein [Bacillota bacterium]|nr:MalY/PatB family protein [Bacillota bacterium]